MQEDYYCGAKSRGWKYVVPN